MPPRSLFLDSQGSVVEFQAVLRGAGAPLSPSARSAALPKAAGDRPLRPSSYWQTAGEVTFSGARPTITCSHDARSSRGWAHFPTLSSQV
jgi:hypothetical protein